MDYNLTKKHIKNTKITSSSPLALKRKLIQQFEFLGNLGHAWNMLLESEFLLSNNFFHTNLLIFFYKFKPKNLIL